MKKSERFYMAMIAVVEDNCINSDSKLEVLETLMESKSVAEYTEKREETENESV